MTLPQAPALFRLLGDDIRWQLLVALADTDLRVQELVERVGRPQNAVSYHLRQLESHGVVRERRSIADGREVYYSLDLDQIGQLYRETGMSLHPSLVKPDANPSGPLILHDPLRVLFLCTHNSARSQLAEGILRSRVHGPIEVFSAGTQPTGIHPLAVRAAAALGVDIRRQQSKHADEYINQEFDYIVTVCDRARETCPVFPGDPVRVHWSIPDPLDVEGDEDVRYAAFLQTADEISRRVGYFLIAIRETHLQPNS